MRSPLALLGPVTVAILVVIGASPSALAQKAPNPIPLPDDPPPEPEPEPAPSTTGEEPPPVPVPDDDVPPPTPAPGDAPPAPSTKPEEKKPEAPKNALPLPDAKSGIGAGPCWGSTTGCAIAGAPLAVGTGVGCATLLTFLSSALAQTGLSGVCLAIIGIGGGFVIGAPSALLLGPCAATGALVGGLVGGAFEKKEVVPVLIGSIPGFCVGTLSTAGVVWGLIVLTNTSGDFIFPASILALSTGVGLAAGPVTVAGITIADAVTGPPSFPEPKDAVDARAPTTTPAVPPAGAPMTAPEHEPSAPASSPATPEAPEPAPVQVAQWASAMAF